MSSSKPNEYKKYGTPAKLLADTRLSDAKKKTLLEQWYEDEEALSRASGEGLTGGRDYQLHDVLEALKELKCEDDLNNNI